MAMIVYLKKIINCLPQDEQSQHFWKEIYEWPTQQDGENEEETNDD